jgi:hypothetical protein
MIRSYREFLASIIPAAVLFAVAVPLVRADEGEVVCATIVPCNPDGTVFAPYDQGACAPLYRSQCLSQRANELSEVEASCQVSMAELQKRVKALSRKNRALRRGARR